MMDTRQTPQLGIEPLRESHLKTLNDFCSQMEVAMKEACSALSRAVDDMACFYDAHQREAPLYVVGDKVWLNRQNITTTRLMKKLDHKWLGLYSECIPTQTAVVIQLNTPCILSHPVTTPQHRCDN